MTVTLDTYSHVLPSMQREAAAKLDEMLAPTTADEPDDVPPRTVVERAPQSQPVVRRFRVVG